MSTVSGFFFDDGPLSKDQENKLLANANVNVIAQAVRVFSAATAKLPFAEDLGAQVKQALERPLTDGVIGALKTWSELREFTDPAKHPAEEQNTYSLADNTVKSTYKPKLELLVNGTKRWTIQLVAEVALELESGNLLIRGGRIWEVRLGQVTCSGTLRIEGTDLVSKKSKSIALPGVIKFEQGLPIPA